MVSYLKNCTKNAILEIHFFEDTAAKELLRNQQKPSELLILNSQLA